MGSKEAACNREFLESNNIKWVLNCAEEVIDRSHTDQVSRLHVPYGHDDTALEKLEKATEFIANAVYLKEGVLVHCNAGLSRYAAL